MTWFTWALLGALFWGIGPIMAKAGLVNVDPWLALTIRTLGAAVILILLAVPLGTLGQLRTVDPRSAALLLGEAMTASLLAHLAFYSALRLGDASAVVPVIASYPALTILLSALVLREQITPARLGGALLIVAGVYLIRRF